ncbi:MAG: HTH-type transcriptional regulator ArgP [Pseudomonadota bacterium]
MFDARQLEALSAVAEHGSFGSAAKSLSITLAAVSLRIKSLEEALGQRLIVRGKQTRLTPPGQQLLAHVKQVRLMEADLLTGIQGPLRRGKTTPFQSLSVAVNADSLTSWFLPGVAEALERYRLLLDIAIDDQDHTHDALKSGDVVGCVTTLPQAMRGCVSEPLGIMRYRCVAAPALVESWRGGKPGGKVVVQRMLASPAVIFNRKDALQDAFLAQHFNLRGALYPRHFVPAVDAFNLALELGMGWGMLPEQQLTGRLGQTLAQVFPGATVDVALYWQRWQKEPVLAQRLTTAVKDAARQQLMLV